MENTYQPISCQIYDQLEAAAILRQPCNFVISDGFMTVEVREKQIKDLFVENHIEYAVLEDQTTFRLDHLVVFNGEAIGDACAYPGERS